MFPRVRAYVFVCFAHFTIPKKNKELAVAYYRNLRVTCSIALDVIKLISKRNLMIRFHIYR